LNIENGFALLTDRNRIGVYRDGSWRSMSFIGDNALNLSSLSLSDTGLVATVAGDEGAVLLPGSDKFRHIELEGRPTTISVRGSYVAWGLFDGTVKILDVDSNREWSLKAHAQAVSCVKLLREKNQLLTCSGNEVRFWSLAPNAPVLVATLPYQTFNVALDRRGDAIIDGFGGDVYMLRKAASRPVRLHHHETVAFGVAWCDSRPCSTSWGGQVLCSSDDGSVTETVAAFGAPIRWISSGADRCFVAVSDGGVYDLRSPASPVYRHDGEPYQIMVSPDGRFVASNDWNGGLKIWDVSHRGIRGEMSGIHTGRLTDLAWLDDELAISAADGTIRLLTLQAKEIRRWQLGSPVRYMKASARRIVALTADGVIWSVVLANDAQSRIQTGAHFSALASSPDGHRFAVGTSEGEVFMLDEQAQVEIQRFAKGDIGGMAFEDENILLVSDAIGRLFRFQSNRNGEQ
jgi:WD40 repeat protein